MGIIGGLGGGEGGGRAETCACTPYIANRAVVVGDQVKLECAIENFPNFTTIKCAVNNSESKVTRKCDASTCMIHFIAGKGGLLLLSCKVLCMERVAHMHIHMTCP